MASDGRSPCYMVRPTPPTQPSVSVQGVPDPKRRKAEDEGSNAFAKKQRTRVSFSCGECHRRKQKCDRQIPCSHCIARKVPDLCKAYTPGKTDQDINARLTRLEHIVEAALPQYCTPASPFAMSSEFTEPSRPQRSESTGAEDDVRSHSEEQDACAGAGSFQSGKWYGTSVSGSIAPAPVLEQLENAVSPSISAEGQKRYSHSRHPSHNDASKVALGLSPHLDDTATDSDAEPSPSDKLKILIEECGVSPQSLQELLQELPSQDASDVLINYYFESINWTRYPISERDFRTAYSSIRSNVSGVNANDVRYLPLLFVVLAIAVRLAPESIGGDIKKRRLTSVRYYWCSRRSLLIAAAVQQESLDMVLTRLLSARFLTFDRRITECWSQLGAAVRTAQALGLHRDGFTMGMDPAQVEYRRRIWAYLYHADRSYALALGRPNAIQDDYTSTQPPLNVEDLPTAPIHDPPQLSRPTRMTYVILRHALAVIIGRMVHHFQQVRDPSFYSEVIAIDDDLLKFMKNLPPYFALEPDLSLDATSKYIPAHRFLLITEIMFVRISLHRPYLLRRLNSDRYIRSRSACFESAIKDFQVRQAFRQILPQERRGSLSNAYREFQTAMISGIYLVLEPNGQDSPAMHAILDAFLEENQRLQDMDETTRRELKTIEFLKQKASQMEGRTRTSHLRDSKMQLPLNEESHFGNPNLIQSAPKGRRPSNALSPSRVTFPSVTTGISSPLSSSSVAYAATSNAPHPGPFHRRQHSTNGDSPAGSSLSAEDESTAQSLLDHWCNNISTGPMDGSNILASSWPASTDPHLWPMNQSSLMPVDSSQILGSDSSADWNYWETIVNQIRAGSSFQ